ncbi:MAG: mechanosensitive ion channel family protein [Actinomycetota bacterium]|nr:mechanosensitive ion channel family protein [Actinomycetota bacterium]
MRLRGLRPTDSRPVDDTAWVRLRPDLRRAGVAGVLAVLAAVLGSSFGAVRSHQLHTKLAGLIGALLFVVFAVAAVRSLAGELARVSDPRLGDSRSSVLKLVVTLAGYVVIVFTVLALLSVPVGRLAVSGAVTGVIVGIAAQQSLSNVFAGLVLVLNRPFAVGDEISVRSGALGGPHEGRVLSMGLTYVTLQTDDMVLSLPNSGVLASAVGPRGPATEPADPPSPDATNGAGPAAAAD